jgi:archaellum biogenesis protein FlaJ (TadC family)
MRTFIAVVALALLTVPAYSQEMPGGKKHHRTEQKTDEQKDRKKVDDKAYNDALSRIPTSNEKPDPWRNLR